MNKTREISSFVDHKFTRISRIALKLLGFPGRMLYLSKSMRKPTTIFNANIFNDRAKKIWFGDLEIDRDKQVLLKLSARLGRLYILLESDGRFRTRIPSIAYIREVAWVTVGNGSITYSEQFQQYVEFTRNRLLAAQRTLSKKMKGH